MTTVDLSSIPQVLSVPKNKLFSSIVIHTAAAALLLTGVAVVIGIPLVVVLTASTTTTSSTLSTTATTDTSVTTTSATTITTTSVTTSTATTTTTKTTTTTSSTSTTTSTTSTTSSTSTTTSTTSTTTTPTTSTTTTSTTSITTTSITTTTTSTKTTTTTSTTTTITAVLTVSGPQLNFNPSSLTAAWSLCYTSLYSEPMIANISSILSTCYKNKLLIGCRPVGNTLLTLAAMGNRADVTFNCTASNTMTHQANGVGWYFSTNTPSWNSWGFVSGSDSSLKGNCDGDVSTNSAYRLCWHLVGTSGGYRCGGTVNLDTSTSWERVIYHAM